LERLRHGLLDVRNIGHIAVNVGSRSARFLDVRGNCAALLIVNIKKHGLGAFPAKFLGYCLANPLSRAGDYRYFSIE
jgi:hypothetical protein